MFKGLHSSPGFTVVRGNFTRGAGAPGVSLPLSLPSVLVSLYFCSKSVFKRKEKEKKSRLAAIVWPRKTQRKILVSRRKKKRQILREF